MNSRKGEPVEPTALNNNESKAPHVRMVDVIDRVAHALRMPKMISFAELRQRVRIEPQAGVDQKIEQITETVCSHNEMELLNIGPEAFAEIEKQIGCAEKSISINIFSWASDATGMQLAQKILEAKKKNPALKIQIRIDKVGTFFNGTRQGLRKNMLKLINQHTLTYFLKYRNLSTRKLIAFVFNANAAYKFTDIERAELEKFIEEVFTDKNLIEMNPAMKLLRDVLGDDLILEHNGIERMDHSKVYIFDETMVMSGGMNIGDEYSGGWDAEEGWSGAVRAKYWRDYMIKARGPVSDFAQQALFHSESFESEREPLSDGAIPVRLLRNASGTPDGSKTPEELAKLKQITYAIFAVIDNAEKELIIEHAYLMDQTIIDKLKLASIRDVNITIIRGLPETSSLHRANEDFFAQLNNVPNVLILNDNRILHAKLICADGKHTVVGSANLSRTSLWDNEEVSFFVSGETPLQTRINDEIKKTIERIYNGV
jgi:phosphatidylserine/phosphatidylglycerophosphate/cardiolipin synthase-like enzyme